MSRTDVCVCVVNLGNVGLVCIRVGECLVNVRQVWVGEGEGLLSVEPVSVYMRNPYMDGSLSLSLSLSLCLSLSVWFG